MTQTLSDSAVACAYVGQHHPEQFRRDLEAILRAGIGRLYIPLSEDDQALRLPNLREMIALAREARVETWVMPWGVAGIFDGPFSARFVARRLEARQVDCAGESLPAACPNHPLLDPFIEKWVEDAASTGAQGILLDEPSWARHEVFPDYRGMDVGRLWACRCMTCRQRFRAIYRAEMPEDIDDDVRDFRARSMAAFLCRVGEMAEKRGMRSALRISPYGSPQTWEIVVRQPWVAEIGASVYWMPSRPRRTGEIESFEEYLRRAEAARNLIGGLGAESGIPVAFWLRCFAVPKDDEPLIPRSIESLRAMGGERFVVWSFQGTAALGSLACERPSEAWTATLAALGARAD